jgi:hypothetical protein
MNDVVGVEKKGAVGFQMIRTFHRHREKSAGMPRTSKASPGPSYE